MGNYTYEYPRPALTVDVAVFGLEGDALRVLMVRRKKDPFAGTWAFPGGFVEIEEPFEDAARRELKEETGFEGDAPLEFVGVFGRPERDPRGRTISIAHATVVSGPLPPVKGADDADEAAWLAPDGGIELAFDHAEILASARAWLAARVSVGPIGIAMLPGRFRPDDVAALHRAVFGDDRGALRWRERAEAAGLIRREDASRGGFVGIPAIPAPARYARPFGGP